MKPTVELSILAVFVSVAWCGAGFTAGRKYERSHPAVAAVVVETPTWENAILEMEKARTLSSLWLGGRNARRILIVSPPGCWQRNPNDVLAGF